MTRKRTDNMLIQDDVRDENCEAVETPAVRYYGVGAEERRKELQNKADRLINLPE